MVMMVMDSRKCAASEIRDKAKAVVRALEIAHCKREGDKKP